MLCGHDVKRRRDRDRTNHNAGRGCPLAAAAGVTVRVLSCRRGNVSRLEQ